MTHDKYDTDILKTLKSIDASLKRITKKCTASKHNSRY